MDLEQKDTTDWDQLSYEEKNRVLYEKQNDDGSYYIFGY